MIAGTLTTISGGFLVYKLLTLKANAPQISLVDPQLKYSFELISKEELTHDTRQFRFGLPSEQHILGISIGQHVYLSAIINNELVVRPYSPTSASEQKGYFDLVFKVMRIN